MKRFKKIGWMIFFFLLTFQVVFAGESTLRVVIKNLKNTKGQLLITLFNSGNGFPVKPKTAYKNLVEKIENKTVIVEFQKIPFGEYAVAVVHDENSNNKIDFNMFWVPIEGFGFSNDAKGFIGPPSFKDAKFTCNTTLKTIVVNAQY